MRPWLAFLDWGRDSRVFQHMSVIDIVEAVFSTYQAQGCYHDIKPLERWWKAATLGTLRSTRAEEAKALKQTYKDSMAEMIASTEKRITTDQLIELINERPEQVGGYVAA